MDLWARQHAVLLDAVLAGGIMSTQHTANPHVRRRAYSTMCATGF
jgi:hypothetical protein